jgi:hypothetical protein
MAADRGGPQGEAGEGCSMAPLGTCRVHQKPMTRCIPSNPLTQRADATIGIYSNLS